MTILQEGNLQITFPPNTNPRKFDGNDHGLSHCMKAVDFIIDLDDCYIFIEIKDPQDPNSDPQRSQEFVDQFLSGKIDSILKYKYRDSFIYEYASGKTTKDIYYFVIIAIDTLTAAELNIRTEALKRAIPIHGPNSTPWKQPFIKSCAVFNIQSWNRNLSQFLIQRIS